MDTAKYLQKCMEDCCCDQCLFYQHILDTLVEPMVIVNSRAEIVFINKAYLEFINVSRSSALGKPVQDVIENTRLHQVCINGVSEVDSLQKIHGREAVVHRFPINVDNQIVGAIGKVNFQDVNELNELAKKLKSMEEKLEYYKKDTSSLTSPAYTFKDIIGCSEHFIQVKSTAIKAAQSDMSVLILGETGVGKDLFAQAIHNASPRHRGPFISINCAAIPQDLLESELFGYGEGAFTGARKQGKPGKFELADGGTIFLDEIGDISPKMQSGLLRVLQEGEILRVGSNRPISVDVRIIAATNTDLEEAVEKRKFREDLYYRLNVINLRQVPLRERKDDIILLATNFLVKYRERFKKEVTFLPNSVVEQLLAYDWPGNVRELENVIQRAVLLSREGMISPADLGIRQNRGIPEKTSHLPFPEKYINQPLKESVSLFEAMIISTAIKESSGKVETVCQQLGLAKTTLYEKLKRYGIASRQSDK